MRSLPLLPAVAVLGASVAASTCTPASGPVDESATIDAKADSSTPDAGSRPETGPADTHRGDSGRDGDDGGDGGDGGEQPPQGFPDRISTVGGGTFRGRIDASTTRTVEVDARAGDVVILRLRSASNADLQPALSLFRLSARDREKVAWDEPDTGPAHIPYRDDEVDDGWEFYERGRYALELRNRSDTSGRLLLELTCLEGPCSEETDDSDSDGIADELDNCPEAPNRTQSNTDGDLLGDACDPAPSRIDCPEFEEDRLERRIRAAYRDHDVLDYDSARGKLFGPVGGPDDTLTTAYTGERFRTDGIPDPREFNTEHTVPQSKFDSRTKKTDLHHLFPADSTANSRRSNLPFDVVASADWEESGSKRGRNDRDWEVFEPRDGQKGDAARALFYFSAVYGHDIDIDAEADGWGTGLGDESDLRDWHRRVDPVTVEDRERNDRVHRIQGTRNPFVDCPGFVEKIDDF